MALQKTHTTGSGVDGNYWRVINFHVDPKGKILELQLGLFKDKASSDAGNDVLEQRHFVFSYDTEETDHWTGFFEPATLDTANYNPLERIYEKLKTLTAPIDFTVGTTDV